MRNGKGAKDRVVPLHPALEEALWQWLQSELPLPGPCVFQSQAGRPYDPKSLYKVVRTLLAAAGIRKTRMGPHILRHTFATLLLQTGRVDLVTLQRLLGHGHLQTVVVYAHTDADPMRAAVTAFPPM